MTPSMRNRLLPDDAYLRRLPASLDAHQHRYLQALVHAADALDAAYRRTCLLGWELADPNAGLDRIPDIFLCAWSMLDHLQITGNIVAGLLPKDPGAAYEQFGVQIKGARGIRARLNEQLLDLPNSHIASVPIGASPFFGELRYLVPSETHAHGQGFAVLSGRSVVLTSGTLTETDDANFITPGPDAYDQPIHGLTLRAFENEVSFKLALTALRHLLLAFGARIEEQVSPILRAQSAATRMPLEQLEAPQVGPKRLCRQVAFPTGSTATAMPPS